ncbi:MAG TPA: PEP-CTERM sorting domain-containing protein [Vicinamibacterales bacterium]|nr:PEP-CTERM sorting domain-containing protein [Vicinamibacterales bacterium]
MRLVDTTPALQLLHHLCHPSILGVHMHLPLTRALRVSACLLAALFCAREAASAPISIGVLAYDEFIPGETTTISLLNLTGDPLLGGSSLGPDFPVVTNLVLTNAVLTLQDHSGAQTSLILGDIAPGPLLDSNGEPLFELQFPSATQWVSAQFNASFAGPTLLLDDGRTFLPFELALTTTLLPGAGEFLTPGDLVTIDIDGVFAVPEPPPSTPVPEPSTAALLLTGVVLAVRRRRDPMRS